MIPLKWNNLGEPTGWSPFQKDSKYNSEGEILAIMNSWPPLKGWLNAQIELEDGCRYTVYFSDPIRLQHDVDEAVKSAKPCFAEPGLIILPEVTVKAIQDAVQFLWKQGFFAYLKAE